MIGSMVVDYLQCDGSNPCSRCWIDNAICAFGERKRPHDKVYPKKLVMKDFNLAFLMQC